METEERFDIVVIGAGGDAHEATLAADLSAVMGMPPGEVSLALRHGELYVHRSFGEDDACRAAESLRRLGAEVEIRPTETSGPTPVIEADPEALDQDYVPRPAPSPAPLAPPPAFGRSSSKAKPGARASVAIGTRAPTREPGLVDPSRPQGRPAAPERPFQAAFERASAGRRRPVPPGTAASRPEPVVPELEPDPEEPASSVQRSPEAPAPRGVAGSIDPAESLARQIELAAESGALDIVTLDGESSESVELKLEKTPARPAEPAKPAAKPKAEGEVEVEVELEASPAAVFVPKEEPLALDLGRPPAPRGPVIPDPQLGAAQIPKSAETSYSSGRISSPSGSFSPVQAQRSPDPAEPPPARRLFSRDLLANYLFGVAAGLVIGLVVAFQASRSLDSEDIMALEDKLAESYVKPIEVEAGELQKPQNIEEDLETMYGDTKIFFLLTMIFTGVPAGLALGRIKLG